MDVCFPGVEPVTVDLDWTGGDVRLRSGTDGEDISVRVDGSTLPEPPSVLMLDGGVLQVRCQPEGERGLRQQLRRWSGGEEPGDVTVVVPPGSALRLRVSGGSVDLDGSFSAAEARLAGGDLRAGHLAGARVSVAGGRIDVARCEGSVELAAQGGEIHVGDVLRGLTVQADGGTVDIGRVEGQLEAAVHGGALRVHRLSGGSVTFDVVAGDVLVQVDPGLKVWTDVRTTVGQLLRTLTQRGEPADGESYVSVRGLGVASQVEVADAVPGTAARR